MRTYISIERFEFDISSIYHTFYSLTEMRRWLTTLRHKLLGQPFRDPRYESSAYFFVLNPFELILDFVSRILDKNSKIEKVNSKRNYYSISSKSLFICKIE